MRIRAPILVKLLVALVLPALLLFTVFGFVAHEVSRRDLDEEVGRRLQAIAASAATQVRGKYVEELAPGDEGQRAHQNYVGKLAVLEHATGAHLYMFDKQFGSRLDTDPSVPIGTHYYHVELDRTELARVFDKGETVASVTFEGTDGRTYKAGYAAVRASEDDPTIVLAIGAQAPARYFDRLASLRRSLVWWGVGLAGEFCFDLRLGQLKKVNHPCILSTADHVGSGRAGQVDGLLAVARQPHELQVVGGGDELLQPAADHPVVVGDQDSDHRAAPSKGTSRWTVVPDPGDDSTRNVAPASVARPASPSRPRWPSSAGVEAGSKPRPSSTTSAPARSAVDHARTWTVVASAWEITLRSASWTVR